MAAGTGGCNNLVRSLRRDSPEIYVVGCNDDRFVLKQSTADRLYLTPSLTASSFGHALCRLADREQIDLIVPSGDSDVLALARVRQQLGTRCFLPDDTVITLCQDKFELSRSLADHGVPVPPTHAVTHLDDLDAIFKRLGRQRPVWCRVRAGTRSLGAAPVKSVRQARAWIRYWEEMRGIPRNRFIIAEYLPGRDFMCTSIWRDGHMELVTTFEKLAYFSAESSPSGTSSLSSLAKTVIDQRLVDICRQAIRAVSPSASGVFSVDLRENRNGVPCITEINVGRFFIGMTAFDRVSHHSTASTYVAVALGERVHLPEVYVTAPNNYVIRDLDNLPGILSADDLFTGIATLQDEEPL